MFTKAQIEKIRQIVAVVVGVAMIISGIAIMVMDDSHTGYAGGVSRASTSIAFGADFYTTSAQYTGLAANAVADVFELLQISFGLMFIFAGVLVSVNAGSKLLAAGAADKVVPIEEEELEMLKNELDRQLETMLEEQDDSED